MVLAKNFNDFSEVTQKEKNDQTHSGGGLRGGNEMNESELVAEKY